ncbi:hypothetical protein ACWDZ8_41800 [Streptomyces sp. NPDC003233]
MPDAEALRSEVRAAVAGHPEPCRPPSGRGCGGAGVREPERPLPGAARPYAGSSPFRSPTGPRGERLPTLDRTSCRVFHTVRAEGTCATGRPPAIASGS